MKDLSEKLGKIFNLFTFALVCVLILLLLLTVLTKTELFGGITIIFYIFLGLFSALFIYGFPIFIIVFAVAGYFMEKKKQGITDKGFNKKLIPPMLPAFIINSILTLVIAYTGNYVMTKYVSLF